MLESGTLPFRPERCPGGCGQQPDAGNARSEDLAGHTEVKEQSLARVEVRQEVLADPLEREHTPTVQAPSQLPGRRKKEVAPGGRPDLADRPADQQRPELAARACELLASPRVIPIHWGTFFPVGLKRFAGHHLVVPPHEYQRLASAYAPDTEVRVLEPGSKLSVS